jgi:hypothetical protein
VSKFANKSNILTCLITVELARWRDVVLVQYLAHSLKVSFNLFYVASSAPVAVQDTCLTHRKLATAAFQDQTKPFVTRPSLTPRRNSTIRGYELQILLQVLLGDTIASCSTMDDGVYECTLLVSLKTSLGPFLASTATSPRRRRCSQPLLTPIALAAGLTPMPPCTSFWAVKKLLWAIIYRHVFATSQ